MVIPHYPIIMSSNQQRAMQLKIFLGIKKAEKLKNKWCGSWICYVFKTWMKKNILIFRE